MVNTWLPKYRVIAAEPSPRDICLVLYADGRRVSVHTVDEFEAVAALAKRLAEQFQCQMKLLPMTGAELLAFLNVAPGKLFDAPEEDAEMRALAITTCRSALLNSNEPSVRADAMALLVNLGEMPQ